MLFMYISPCFVTCIATYSGVGNELSLLRASFGSSMFKAEKEDDSHLKEGHLKSAAECEEKIHEIINDFLKEQK